MSSMKLKMTRQELAVMEEKAGLVAETLSAMANPNRLLILCHLAEREKTVGELVEAISLAQSAVSQHLARMRALRLVKARRAGKQVYYVLASDAVASIMKTLYRVYCAAPSARKP